MSIAADIETHGLDTPRQVFFYEQDFYVLSNFSAFRLRWNGLDFPTLEHAYHWEKFNVAPGARQGYHSQVQGIIQHAPSAHEAFKVGQHAQWRPCRRQDWDAVKAGIMGALLRAKVGQHEYVRKKLLATGDRELVENSWRDDYWGWGESRNGKNMLGRLWMQVRDELRGNSTNTPQSK